jgi:hypothetical protein
MSQKHLDSILAVWLVQNNQQSDKRQMQFLQENQNQQESASVQRETRQATLPATRSQNRATLRVQAATCERNCLLSSHISCACHQILGCHTQLLWLRAPSEEEGFANFALQRHSDSGKVQRQQTIRDKKSLQKSGSQLQMHFAFAPLVSVELQMPQTHQPHNLCRSPLAHHHQALAADQRQMCAESVTCLPRDSLCPPLPQVAQLQQVSRLCSRFILLSQ